MPACQQYAVSSALRSRSRRSDNYWLFTGAQRDGQPGTPGGVQRPPLDMVVSSTNLDHDPDAPDGNWATATTVAAVGAAAFGPLPSETLTQLGGFGVGAGVNIGSCLP